MANIALIGATGHVGARILQELSDRGHRVTAIARNPGKAPVMTNVTARAGDVQDRDAMAALLKGHDVVVSSVYFSTTDPVALIGAVRDSGVPRYIVVGGAGSLEVAPGVRLIDSPDFPEAYRAEATGGVAFLDLLRAEPDLDWTFLSPSAMFLAGERTGVFRLGRDTLLSNEHGSSISFEDYAVALVDEIEAPAHTRTRFTVGY